MNGTWERTFPAALRDARKRKGMTQRGAADSIGVVAGTWNQYEKGVSLPGREKAELIATILDEPVDEILVGQTADDFKSRIGCVGDPRYLFIKLTNRFLGWWFRAMQSTFLTPAPPAPRRDVFRETPLEVVNSRRPPRGNEQLESGARGFWGIVGAVLRGGS